MTIIKRKGMPNRQTKGAIGMIYIDTDTGYEYKCTQAYSCSTVAGVQYEYEWKLVYKKTENKPAKKEESITKPVVEEVKEEKEQVTTPVRYNNKTSYTKYYNNNKKK